MPKSLITVVFNGFGRDSIVDKFCICFIKTIIFTNLPVLYISAKHIHLLPEAALPTNACLCVGTVIIVTFLVWRYLTFVGIVQMDPMKVRIEDFT